MSSPCFLMGTIKWCLSSTNWLEKNILRFKMHAGQRWCTWLSNAFWKIGLNLALCPQYSQNAASTTHKEMMLYNITSDHIYAVRLHLRENSTLYLNVSTNLYTWVIALLRNMKDVKVKRCMLTSLERRLWKWGQRSKKEGSAVTYISAPSITLIWLHSEVQSQEIKQGH